MIYYLSDNIFTLPKAIIDAHICVLNLMYTVII